MTERQTGKQIKILWFDQGGEYRKDELIRYCKDHGILQQFTIPHTPQQNGVTKRKNRTLVECARSMLKGKNLSKGFWAEVVNIVVYLKNRSPTKSLESKTPFEALFGFKPVVSHLRAFGCKYFSHIPKENRKKLDSKAIKCIFVRYCTKFKTYKLFNPSTHKVFVRRDVVFHEMVNDGSHESANEEWHIPLLVKEGSDE